MANIKMKTKEIMVKKMPMINIIVSSNQTNMKSTTYKDAIKKNKLQINVVVIEQKMMRSKNTITLTMMLVKITTKN